MSAASKIEEVQLAFQDARATYPIKGSTFLDSIKNHPFCSIGYEAAASWEAIQDIKNEDLEFSHWASFNNKHHNLYEPQIHVGLGWAMGEADFYNAPFLASLNPALAWRVVDGYAYYLGLFKRRVAIRERMIPAVVSDELAHAFNEGLGRSLWYINKGDTRRVLDVINHFDEARRADLFRGVGIASFFTGGLSTDGYLNFISSVDNYSKDLRCGAVMALNSVRKAGLSPNYLLNFAEKVNIELFNKSPGDSFYETILSVSETLHE